MNASVTNQQMQVFSAHEQNGDYSATSAIFRGLKVKINLVHCDVSEKPARFWVIYKKNDIKSKMAIFFQLFGPWVLLENSVQNGRHIRKFARRWTLWLWHSYDLRFVLIGRITVEKLFLRSGRKSSVYWTCSNDKIYYRKVATGLPYLVSSSTFVFNHFQRCKDRGVLAECKLLMFNFSSWVPNRNVNMRIIMIQIGLRALLVW